jgi:hypothetical protein
MGFLLQKSSSSGLTYSAERVVAAAKNAAIDVGVTHGYGI